MYEKRLTIRLLNYWNSLGKNGNMPSFRTWNSALVDDVWGNCIVLELLPSLLAKRECRYVHFGQQVKEVVGKDMTGEILTSQMVLFPGAKIIKRIDDVASLQSPPPLMDDGEFLNQKQQIVKYRACLLAFYEKGHVSHILAGLSWKAF